MTVMEAITRVDEMKPNVCTLAEKLRWLSALDGTVKNEILDVHEGGEDIAFSPYGEDVLPGQALLVPPPYDEMYLRFLEAQIDYACGEYGKYNNSVTLFNTAYEAYEKFYRRTHMPKTKGFRHF
jgi:hypothetical protein